MMFREFFLQPLFIGIFQEVYEIIYDYNEKNGYKISVP
jgi:hypothetical protein